MPKLKTNSGAKKRFKMTKSGKIKRARAFRNHMLECKTPKKKRGLRGTVLVSVSDVNRIRRMMPYA
ncbi:MAG: 50S ribosomal protein L35 [Spirochaetes bacterium]|nr:50S ribosomal protein L35 [Spirochaetota bacterium]